MLEQFFFENLFFAHFPRVQSCCCFWQSWLKSAATFLFLAFLLIIVESETAERRRGGFYEQRRGRQWKQWNNYKRSALLSRDNAPHQTRPDKTRWETFARTWKILKTDCTDSECNSSTKMIASILKCWSFPSWIRWYGLPLWIFMWFNAVKMWI